jgi:hypothetical protein
MKKPEAEKIFFTDKDLEAMGLGSAQARRNKRCKGEDPIPYIRIGRLVRYHIDDVRAYVARNRVESGGK